MSATPIKHILCIDDADSCELVAAIMGKLEYKVERVTTAKEGLEKVQQGKYDLILLDLHLEDESGVNLCRKIRQFDANTPILFYSAEARESKIKEAMAAGAQGFLVKPVDPVDIQNYVRRHTGSLMIN